MFGWFKGSKKDKKPVKEVLEDDPDVDESKIDKEIESKIYNIEIPEEDNDAVKNPNYTPLYILFEKLYKGYLNLTKEEIHEAINSFKYFEIEEKEVIRHELGHKKGGKICEDKEVLNKMRSIGKEMLKEIGKKVLTGSLNLTTIPFPIKCAIPQTCLETSIHATCLFPFYLGLATIQKNPVDRFKFVVTALVSSFNWTNTFLKPLNPILGETLEGTFTDGTAVFCEQTCHHPPVSQFLAVGPEKSYIYSGYYCYSVRAGLNSVSILNTGKRYIKFKDGQTIRFNFPDEYYCGTLIGTLRQESYNILQFNDDQNNISCEIKLGKVKHQPSDFFRGEIKQNNKAIHEIYGSYIGFLDIDKVRYWDYRQVIPLKISLAQSDLPSDSLNRTDLCLLKENKIAEAQKQKEILENLQRHDKKLRENYQKDKAKRIKNEVKQAKLDAKKKK